MDPADVVLHHTRPVDVPAVPGIRLYLADDFLELWHATADMLDEITLPFWGAVWAGGIGVARALAKQPELVAGKTVLDIGCGSGLCGITAMKSGAHSVTFVDVNPLACAATSLNLQVNEVPGTVLRKDALVEPLPEAEVVLVGDLFYDRRLAAELLPRMRRMARSGSLVLAGDPGRPYMPRDGIARVYTCEVEGLADLEDADRKTVSVCTIEADVSES